MIPKKLQTEVVELISEALDKMPGQLAVTATGKMFEVKNSERAEPLLPLELGERLWEARQQLAQAHRLIAEEPTRAREGEGGEASDG